LIALAGLALAWQVAAHSLVAYLAEAAPEWALSLSPGDAEALSRIADARLSALAASDGSGSAGAAPTVSRRSRELAGAIRAKGIAAPLVPPDIGAREREEIRRYATTALLENPLDPRPLRILGQIAETEDRARVFMRGSLARSLHETLAAYWLMQDAFLRTDFSGAIRYADVVLRSRLSMMNWIAPTLLRLAPTPEGREPLVALLSTGPPWRPYFFAALPGATSDARAPIDLMLDLQKSGAPPTRDELRPYLDFLVDKKFYDLAYYAWLQFLPENELEKTGLLFNGDFAWDSENLPFDWDLRSGGGVRLGVGRPEARSDGRGLRVEFTAGLVGPHGARQLVVLKPGTYIFAGREMGSLRTRRGLRWSVACVGGVSDPLGQSEPFAESSLNWKDFSFSFAVPDGDCPAQQVSLQLDARFDADRMASGSAWFTGLGISPSP
jgi:hypothetical protein